MRRFAYETNGKNGRVGTFFLPQTPQEFASRVTRRVSSSKFMDGVKHFSMLVWALPEGVTHIDDVPYSSPARATYIQCGGAPAVWVSPDLSGARVVVPVQQTVSMDGVPKRVVYPMVTINLAPNEDGSSWQVVSLSSR